MTPTYNITNIRLSTAFFSALLSILAFYADDIINSDGILYMNSASVYLQSGLASIPRAEGWPFFSMLVAYFHQITGASFELSAQILNIGFFVLLTDALVLISYKILPSHRQLVIAALFIICFQTLNEYRDFIFRDAGYWAFCSLALYRFMLFLDDPTVRNATLWQILIVIATLFRVEGIIVLALLPFFLFFERPIKIALKQGLQLNYLFIIAVILGLIFAIGQAGLSASFGKLASASYYLDADRLLALFNAKTNIISTKVLIPLSAEYSALILVSGLLAMLASKLFKGLSFAYLGIYLLSCYQQKDQRTIPYQKLLIYFTLLNLFILIIFIFHKYFVSARYLNMTLIGTLLLILPALCQYVEKAWLSKNKTILTIVSILLFISLVDSLTQSNSKSYIKETAIWASQNLPENSTVLTNDEFLNYYFNNHQPKAKSTLIKKSLASYQDYDYVFVVEKRKYKKRDAFLTKMDITPIFSLAEKRGDKASIYKVNH